MTDKFYVTTTDVIELKMTDDEYNHIQSLLSYYMKKCQNDIAKFSWYDFKYISSALEYARKEGENNANDQ